MLALVAPGRLRHRRAVPRAVLRGGGLRDVPEPARRARGLGHRAGVPACVRATERLRGVALAALVVGGAVGCRRVRPAATRAAGAHGERPDRPRSRARSRRCKADPNLATERTIKTLRWKRFERAEAVRHAARGSHWIARAASAGSRSRRACWSGCAVVGAGRHCWSSTSSALARGARRAARRGRVRRADARAGSRHPAREPARRHRRAPRGAVGSRRASRGAGAAVPRAAVAARARPPRADSRFEHRRRLPGARGAPSARRDDASTPRAWSRVWQRFVYGGQDIAGGDRARAVRRLRARARSPRRRSIRWRREAPHDARRVIWRARRRAARGARRLDRAATRTGRTPRCRCRRRARRSPIRSTPRSDSPRRSARAPRGIACSRIPPADAVIVLSAWHWNLSAAAPRGARALGRVGRPSGRRRDAGRRTEDEFERWSGIVRDVPASGMTAEDSEWSRSKTRPCRAVPGGRARGSRPAGRQRLRLFDVRSRPLVVRSTSTQGRRVGAPRRVRHPGAARAGRSRQRHRHQRDAVPRPEPVRRRSRPAVRGGHAAAARRRRALPLGRRPPVAAGAALALRRAGRAARAGAASALALWRGGVRFGPLARRADAGAPLAGRADSRHGAVRAAPRRRRARCTRPPCARSTKPHDAGSPATRSSSAERARRRAGAPHRLRSDDARGRGSPRRRAPLRTSCAARSRCSKPRGAELLIEHTRSTHGTD